MEDSKTKSSQIKVVLLGDSGISSLSFNPSGVGKSSILLRFVVGTFSERSEATLGGAFMAKMYTYQNTVLKYQIWDTAGQEKYHALAPMYYKEAQVALVVYDVTKAASFDSLMKWIEELRESGPQGMMIIIVGNKIDSDIEEVKYETAATYAKEIGALIRLTSAKEDRGIKFKEMFDEISKEYLKRAQSNVTKPGGGGVVIGGGGKDVDPNRSKGCCS